MRKIINPGIVLMLLVAGYQSGISALVKILTHEITTEVQVLAYYAVPLFFFIPTIMKLGNKDFKSEMLLLHFCRGLFAASSVFCFFYASQNLPLGVAAVLFNSSPIFVPLLARIFIGEKTSVIVYAGIFISLIGIILIIHPAISGFISVTALIGLSSGFLMAVASVFLRYMVKAGESFNKIVFFLYLMSCTVSILLIGGKCIVNNNVLAAFQINMAHIYFIICVLLLLGITSIVAQKTLTKAFQYMPAGMLMPFLYVSVPISSLIGWMFWDQKLTKSMILGTIIVIAGVSLIMFENKVRQVIKYVYIKIFTYSTSITEN
jgi:drug/metabolite transporter (DMT)-like permease